MDRGIFFCLILIYKKLRVELEMPKFNKTYMLKQNPIDTRRVYMLAKHDKGLNVVLSKNKKN